MRSVKTGYFSRKWEARAFWDSGTLALVVASSSFDRPLVLVVDRVIGGSGFRVLLSDLVGEARGGSLFGGMDRHDGGGGSGSGMTVLVGCMYWGVAVNSIGSWRLVCFEGKEEAK